MFTLFRARNEAQGNMHALCYSLFVLLHCIGGSWWAKFSSATGRTNEELVHAAPFTSNHVWLAELVEFI